MSNLLDRSSIILTPTAYDNGKVLCVKPSDGSGDFDFSRNSAATRVNAQGLVEDVQILSGNKITNGDFSNGSTDWIIEAAWTISGGVANGNGANGSNEELVQQGALTAAKNYSITYEIKNYVSGSVKIRKPNGTTRTANGVYTEILLANSGAIIFRGGNFNGSITNIIAKEITDDTNLPRINYEGFSFDGSGDIIPDSGCGSWLWEPQSTNLYLNSETLSTQTITTTANQYSVSFYGTGTITFSGTHTGSLIGTGLNDRVTATFSATAGTLTSTVSGTVTKAQIEQLSFATSYIPTTTTSVTRNQDVCTNGGSVSTISSTSGVLYAEIASLTQDDTFRIISLCDGQDENRVSIAYNNVINELSFSCRVNDVNQFVFTKTLADTTSFHKFALSYKLNEFKVYIDGVQESVQLSGSVYPANTLNELTFDRGLSSFPFFGKTKCLAVWKETLSDEELAELTTI